MKVWKRNAVVATVLVMICAGVYLNWAANRQAVDLVETLDQEQLLDGTTLVISETPGESVEVGEMSQDVSDSFAQIRLSRQESRDSAVETLQETIAFEDGNESAVSAAASLDLIVSDALAEARIESLVIAKGFEDCVAYMNDDNIQVAVSAPQNGLSAEQVAMISDIVTSQSDYEMMDIRVIEVK